MKNSRAIATKIIFSVIAEKTPLTVLLQSNKNLSSLEKAFCFEFFRYFYQLEAITESLLSEPLTQKKLIIKYLIMLGILQIEHMQTPDFAAINETVNAAKDLNQNWATKLINGVLRNFIRNKEDIVNKVKNYSSFKCNHPSWFIGKVKNYYPNDYESILSANNNRAPLAIRINLNKISKEYFIEKLKDLKISYEDPKINDCGLFIDKTTDITSLELFKQGFFSVQDFSAQFAAEILQPEANDTILDACAAPGGKTCHILEKQPDLKEIIAIDVSNNRLKQIQENLNRLNLNATTIAADASDIESWNKNNIHFDKILLDAPCSATGIIRRHPDIKVLRTEKDIKDINIAQAKLLKNLWKILKPGGILVYATCSILAEENENILKEFFKNHDNAKELPLNLPFAIKKDVGLQIIPGTKDLDGFYYAKIQKV